MSELKIGKRYTYKNHVYEIVNLGRMKSDEDWVDSVGYKRVLVRGDEQYKKVDTTTVYTCSRDMFEELFLPRTLELGDRIIAVSMGKTLKEYIVKEVYDKAHSIEYSALNGNSTKCSLVSSDIINFNGSIRVLQPDDSLSHINCVEYYFISNQTRKIITRKGKIEDIRSMLMTMHEAFGKIDLAKFRADDMLDKYLMSIYDFIIEIQKDGYINGLNTRNNRRYE